ncbi:L domain-like protein [Fistulina hepatica ATCC 64428]|uniref:L domain-like protein n=1 Tax=Fistulina hepatica ATCC 64428 TaxID=1128425 RepID=A0A0D7ALW4_9AGAR|nr:L domain-like protein [Fistulina hepatica ATCC 64428]
MSRIPVSPSRSLNNRSPLKTPSAPTSRPRSRLSPTPTSGRRTPSKARSRANSRVDPNDKPDNIGKVPPVPQLSIKEIIALKRAEAKKAHKPTTPSHGFAGGDSLEDAIPIPAIQEEEDILGRHPVRETIERARTSGSLNLSARSLPCLPSVLFEIHLGVTPEPLKSVPNEPPLPPNAPSRNGKQTSASWFDAKDLEVLKAMNNDIVEIQSEISLFGSLKVVDLHKNKIERLPDSIADLMLLTNLDVSYNALTELPTQIFALPNLTVLNISHNQCTSLPLMSPFNAPGKSPNRNARDDFFSPVIERATSPLPRLTTLNASHNRLEARNVDARLPHALVRFDLSENPLGFGNACVDLLRACGNSKSLKELRLANSFVDDESFPEDLFSGPAFPCLSLLDAEETRLTRVGVERALRCMKQTLDFNFVKMEPAEGVTRVLVGHRVVKEKWEIEVEELARRRGRERAHSTTAASERSAGAPDPAASTLKEKEKEAWEIEAEQGLLTEGGRRRARAAAAAAEARTSESLMLKLKSPSVQSILSSSKYYSSKTLTLILPPSESAQRHTRALSFAPSALSRSASTDDLKIPSPILPLDVISTQAFAPTLLILFAMNRRRDRSFSLSADCEKSPLPRLEELDISGCHLADSVPVSRGDAASTPELLLPLLTDLFPRLQVLNLQENSITSASLTVDALSNLILAAPGRVGLRKLVLQGNHIGSLDGFREIALHFKGNRQVPEWKLEELDLSHNDIQQVPPEMGLLPLDVLLLEGNRFAGPLKRAWEREGTKGLLSYLRTILP